MGDMLPQTLNQIQYAIESLNNSCYENVLSMERIRADTLFGGIDFILLFYRSASGSREM